MAALHEHGKLETLLCKAMEKNKHLIQLRGFRSHDAQTPSIPKNQTEIWQHEKSSSMLIILFQGIDLSSDASGEAVYTIVLSYKSF